MAFMGLLIANAVLTILLIILFIAVVFLIIAIILKIVGKKKDSKGFRIAGNVFFVLSGLNALPLILIAGYMIFATTFTYEEMPDGDRKYILMSDIDKLNEIVNENSFDTAEKLDKLLNRSPNLVYYLDVNKKGVIDFGLENGNFAVVETAIEHGAKFDDPRRYDHMAYEHNSMDYYLSEIQYRSITEDDVQIVKLMFKENASVEFSSKPLVCSNFFGEAVWAILYNNEKVTDTELEFLDVFIENGLSSDDKLLLYEEKPSNVSFSPQMYTSPEKDDNYMKLMELIGK